MWLASLVWQQQIPWLSKENIFKDLADQLFWQWRDQYMLSPVLSDYYNHQQRPPQLIRCQF